MVHYKISNTKEGRKGVTQEQRGYKKTKSKTGGVIQSYQ